MDWELSIDDVEATVVDALRKRNAHRRPGQDVSELSQLWRGRARDAWAWKYRTHVAILISGLIARAADAAADPLCLQVDAEAARPGSFRASAVWTVYFKLANKAGVSMRGLKDQPHNNSPYMRMSYLTGRTDSSDKFTQLFVRTTTEWLTEVATYSREGAEAALDAFLYEVPDEDRVGEFALTAIASLDPDEVLTAFEQFIEADTEHGRRGQALLAACLRLLHGEAMSTPESINDPTRNALGDVTVRSVSHAQGAEAKQKPVTLSHVRKTAESLRSKQVEATLVYGALANHDADKPLAARWREITRETGVLTVVHDDSATLIRDIVIATGRPFTDAVVALCHLFAVQLAHVGARNDTLAEWFEVAATFGVDVEFAVTPGDQAEDAEAQEPNVSIDEAESVEDIGYRDLASDPEQQAAQEERRARPRRWGEED